MRNPISAGLKMLCAMLAACGTISDGTRTDAALAIDMRAFALGAVGAQTGVETDDIARFQVRVALPGAQGNLLDRSVDVDDPTVTPHPDDPNARVMRIAFAIPSGSDGDEFTLQIDAFSPGGVRLFQMGPVNFTLTGSRSVTVEPEYVGPGSEVTQVELAPRSLTVQVGQTVPFACVGQPGNAATFPREISVVHPSVATIDGGAVRGVATGVTELICRLPFGTRDEDRIPVTVAPAVNPTLTIQSGNGQTAPATTALPNHLVVIARNTDGSPASGIVVQFAPVGNAGSANPASAVTDAAGLASTTWTLGAAVGQQLLRATANIQGVTREVEAGAIATAPPTTGNVSGHARNTSASPLAGVTVNLRLGAGNTTGPTVRAAVVTGANGAFEFLDLAPGVYTLQASATGFETDVSTLTVVPGQTTVVNLTMQTIPTTGTIMGTVTNGFFPSPIPGATVDLRAGIGPSNPVVMSRITNAQGMYEFTDVTPGVYTVTATAPGYFGSANQLTAVAAETVVVNLVLFPIVIDGGPPAIRKGK